LLSIGCWLIVEVGAETFESETKSLFKLVIAPPDLTSLTCLTGSLVTLGDALTGTDEFGWAMEAAALVGVVVGTDEALIAVGLLVGSGLLEEGVDDVFG
jgi:hypothetical protein